MGESRKGDTKCPIFMDHLKRANNYLPLKRDNQFRNYKLKIAICPIMIFKVMTGKKSFY